MPIMNRRNFLAKAGTLASGALTLTSPVNLWPDSSEPNLKFPSEPRARLAVASWPFRMFIESPANRWARDPKLPGMDLKDFAAMIVKKFNVLGIEPLNQHFRSTEMSYVQEVREATEKAGAHVVDLPTDVGASFYDTNPEKRKVAVANGRKWVDIAHTMGSPSIRAHIEGPPHVAPDVDRAAESLRQLADYGAAKKILINLENDDNRTEDPFFIVKVLEKVNHPYLRALPDFCNSMLTHDQDFNNRAMDAMFRHAYNIAHVKDSEMDGGKVYTVDVAKCFEIARAVGYRGYFSMEWEGAGEPYEGTQKLIEQSLKCLAGVS